MIDAFTVAAPVGSVPRTIMELAIGTGQRIGDLLKMRWDHIDGDGIAVRQGKTKTALWIPFTPRLREYLAQLRFRNLTIAAGPKGSPVTHHSAAAAIRALRAQIGALPFTIHGWRYTCRVAACGCGCH
jgi:integrase